MVLHKCLRHLWATAPGLMNHHELQHSDRFMTVKTTELSIYAADRRLSVSVRLKHQISQQDARLQNKLSLSTRCKCEATRASIMMGHSSARHFGFPVPWLLRHPFCQFLFICKHICIGQKSISGIFLNSSLANFLRQVISLNLELTNLARLSSHQGYTRILPGFYMDAQHPNSSAPRHVASTLLMEPCYHYLQLLLHASMYTMYICSDCRGQKRVSEALELKLWMVRSHHVDAGNRTLVLCKKKQVFKFAKPSFQSSPPPIFFFLEDLLYSTNWPWWRLG